MSEERAWQGPFVRFLASGVFNTGATYLLYLALLRVLPYWWSYTLSYAAGIALAYLLYRHFVFQRSAGRLGPLWVAGIHLFQYGLGLALVALWVQALGGAPAWGPVFALAFQVPVTFLLNRWVFHR